MRFRLAAQGQAKTIISDTLAVQTQRHDIPGGRTSVQFIAGGTQSGVTVHSSSICSRGSRPIPAPALVRVGATGLDGDTLPPSSADTAHRFTYVRHRHRVSSLAAVPAHGG
jgi:hypothetical protein